MENSGNYMNYIILSGFDKRGLISMTDAIVAMTLKLAMIILHSLRIPSPTHFLCGCGKYTHYPMSKIENRMFYTSGLTATTSDRRLSTALNVGFVK